MTSAAGSIGIGVNIDAGDLASQITREVTAALGPMLREVRGDVDLISRALSGIDTSGITEIGTAATQASQQATTQINGITQAASRAGNAVGASISSGARTASQSLQRIDANALTGIIRGAENAGAELAQLDRWQLNDLIATANRAGQNIGQGVAAGASQAERAMAQLDAAGLERLISEATRARGAIGEVEQEVDQAEQATGELGNSFGNAAGQATALVGGIAGIGGAMAVAEEAMSRISIGNVLAAQLNLTKDESAQAGKIAGDLYAQNYGESFEQVSEATGAVMSTLANLADEGPAQVEKLTTAALILADTFGTDVAESTQSVNNLIRNGLAKDGVEGFDLLGRAMQRVPAAMRDEIIPVIDEYAVSFAAAGMTGEEAMGVVVNAAQDGTIAMDKAGDSIKEFIIRATDIDDKAAQEALAGLGLNARQMSTDLLVGGEAAGSAFNTIIEKLSAIEDPAAQASASIAIFGTPLEDLSKNQIPQFLAQVTNGASAMGDFSGSIDGMGEALSNGPGASLETFKRQVQDTLIDGLGNAAHFVMENKDLAIGLGIAIGGVAAILIGANVLMWGYAAALNAITIATTVWSGVTKAAAAVQTAFNAVFVASPIGLIVVAIAAVVAALVLFFTKTEMGRKAFAKLSEWAVAAWDAIKIGAIWMWENALKPVFDAIMVAVGFVMDHWKIFAGVLLVIMGPVGIVIGAIVLIVQHFDKVKTVLGVVADALIWFWQTVLVPTFDAIGAVISTWWNNFVLPVFEAWRFIIMDVLVPVIMFLWNNVISPAFSAIGSIISLWWNNLVMPVFEAWRFVIMDVLVPAIMWLWNNVVAPAFAAIGSIISFMWTTVVAPVFEAFRFVIMDIITPAIMWLWNNVVAPAFAAIGAIISNIWTNVLSPVFGFLSGGLRSVGDVVSWLWNEIVVPAWNAMGDAVKFVWENVISPAFDALKGGLQSVGDFFGTIVGGIGTVWDGLKSILAVPINFMIGTVYNNGIRKAWNTVAKFLPGIEEAGELPLIPEHNTGGKIRGPGGIDNVLMWGTAGEHMLTVDEVQKIGGHSAVYAIRDMIARGVPFEWDGGRVIQKLGSSNVSRYGAEVQRKGLGKADPAGMFGLLQAHDDGGEILPWMHQLLAGHNFAKANSPGPYIWGEWDCSAWMSRIADSILGGPGNKNWFTGSFPGSQPWVSGLGEGMSVGVNNDPGGPGGGHTSGTLSAIPLLGIPSAVNVESGGGTGQGPTYGGPAVGADDGQWVGANPGQFHLGIGANGFFQSGGGGGAAGPSPAEQKGYLEKKVEDIFKKIVDPIADTIEGTIGAPPPEFLGLPRKYMDTGVETAVSGAFALIGGLGDAIGAAWTKAQGISDSILGGTVDAGKAVFKALTPFDQGGIARGTGYMPKDVIAPERVLDPQQTILFETMVQALSSIAGGAVHSGRNDLEDAVHSGFMSAATLMGLDVPDGTRGRDVGAGLENDAAAAIDATGRMMSDTSALIERTSSSEATTAARQHEQMMAVFDELAQQLTEKVLTPMVAKGVEEAIGSQTTDQTMKSFATTVGTVAGNTMAAAASNSAAFAGVFDEGGLWPSGTLGANLSGSHERVLDPGQTKAFDAGLLGGWNAQPQQQNMAAMSSAVGGATNPTTIGSDFFGVGGIGGGILNLLVNTLLTVIGVQIAVRDTITDMANEVRAFRGDFSEYDATGRLTSDTSGMMDRSGSSGDVVQNERMRILKDILSGLIKFMINEVIMPMITAGVSAITQAATTAIGGAIGTAIGGPAGTAVGGALGNVIGAGLTGLLGVGTSLIGAILAGSVDSILGGVFGLFDQGGVANGVGLMPKNVISPERVLSPSNTKSFDKLVDALASGKLNVGGNTTIHAPFTVTGGKSDAETVRNRLLSLMN